MWRRFRQFSERARSWRPRAGALLWLGLTSCGETQVGTTPSAEVLVDHRLWVLTETANSDPFALSRERPAVQACETGANFEPSPGSLEVELARCRERYASFHQPSLIALQVGDELNFTLSHLLLRPLTESVTEAYLALSVNGMVIWQLTLQIIAPANNYSLSVPIENEAPLGSDVVLHLDNHGENSYTFSPMEVSRGPDSP